MFVLSLNFSLSRKVSFLRFRWHCFYQFPANAHARFGGRPPITKEPGPNDPLQTFSSAIPLRAYPDIPVSMPKFPTHRRHKDTDIPFANEQIVSDNRTEFLYPTLSNTAANRYCRVDFACDTRRNAPENRCFYRLQDITAFAICSIAPYFLPSTARGKTTLFCGYARGKFVAIPCRALIKARQGQKYLTPHDSATTLML